MPDPVPVASPTGQPTLPGFVRRSLPYIALVVIVATALIAAGVFDGFPLAQKIAAAVVGIGAALGIASPGTRRTLGAFLLVGALSLTACAGLQRIGRATVDCVAPDGDEHARAVAGAVVDALSGPTTEWQESLDRLALNYGSAVVICAAQAVVAELERALTKPPPGAAVATYYVSADGMDELRLTRARRWLDANGVTKR